MTARSRKPTDASSAPGLDEVADELYGLPPEEFTAARTRYEKQARQAGDRELAARVHGLAKPSVAAWLANQLVRERREELLPLAELGAGLREATEKLAGDELRQLSRQQRELVYALVQQARQIARASGHSVSEDTAHRLEETLQAAVADEHAAEQLLSGRLTEALHHTGFGNPPAPDGGGTIREVSKPAHRRPRAEMRRAEHDLAEAERAVTEATKTRDHAEAQAADAEQVATAAEDEVERLRQLLREASAAASEADRLHRERITALRQAERAVREAERRHADAQRRRDRP